MTLSEIFASDLRGHSYIQARGLTPQVVRDARHECLKCKREEILPAVLNIIESRRNHARN